MFEEQILRLLAKSPQISHLLARERTHRFRSRRGNKPAAASPATPSP
jgi:hypothetical protein